MPLGKPGPQAFNVRRFSDSVQWGHENPSGSNTVLTGSLLPTQVWFVG